MARYEMRVLTVTFTVDTKRCDPDTLHTLLRITIQRSMDDFQYAHPDVMPIPADVA